LPDSHLKNYSFEVSKFIEKDLNKLMKQVQNFLTTNSEMGFFKEIEENYKKKWKINSPKISWM